MIRSGAGHIVMSVKSRNFDVETNIADLHCKTE